MRTPDENAALDYYLRIVQAELGLDNWRITITHDDQPEGADADIWLRTAHREARIRLARDILERDEAVLTENVVHELVHCICDDVMELLPTAGALGKVADRTFEIMVDDLARVLAPRVTSWGMAMARRGAGGGATP